MCVLPYAHLKAASFKHAQQIKYTIDDRHYNK